MKLLFTRFPLESSLGGAEIQTISLMEGLLGRGHAVVFVGSCPILLQLCKERGIPAIELNIGPPPVTKWGAISFLWRKAAMRRKLLDVLSGFHDLDAIVMLSLSEKFLATEEMMRHGTRVFWIEHDSVGRWLTRNPWLPKLRSASNLATTVTVSELSRKIFLDLGWDAARIVAIPNGIDLKRFSSESSDSSVSSESSIKIACISRLAPEKGVDLLIEAVQNTKNIQLTIVGKGKEESRLKALIQSSASSILPSVPNLQTLYCSHDIFVLPSRNNDPFGLVAAEAMVLGIPVVVTDACGIAGYLEDGKTAVIVKAGSSETLREGIERLRDPAVRKRVRDAGKTFAEEHFSLERMIDRYETLLRKP